MNKLIEFESNLDDLLIFSKKIAGISRKGDWFFLKGDLGAGKTTFVKGILKGFQFADEVTSPTFSLINEYNADKKVIHIDCYREKELERWILLGINEYFDNSNIVIIEWPNIIKSVLPNKNLYEFKFSHISNNKRSINLIR